jgi:protein-tyrosine-phosphatase
MGNYYRSRLAEELALHYAAQKGIEISVDSGGLSHIPNPNHPGTIAKATLYYLQQKNITPVNAGRFPKNCIAADVYAADIVILTDSDEQHQLFLQQFPDFTGEIVHWYARDIQFDSFITTTERIDNSVRQLLEELFRE